MPGAYWFPGAEREYPRCRLFFVSILTYSLSSRASSRSFRTAENTSPRICNAAARSTAVLSGIAESFNTRSHVSRNTESISSLVPCQTTNGTNKIADERGKLRREGQRDTLKRAWRPFSAACSSRRFFSSGLRLPDCSACCIWSNTALSSIADRRVDTLQNVSESKWRTDEK
jgi:hypothetical protein